MRLNWPTSAFGKRQQRPGHAQLREERYESAIQLIKSITAQGTIMKGLPRSLPGNRVP